MYLYLLRTLGCTGDEEISGQGVLWMLCAAALQFPAAAILAAVFPKASVIVFCLSSLDADLMLGHRSYTSCGGTGDPPLCAVVGSVMQGVDSVCTRRYREWLR